MEKIAVAGIFFGCTPAYSNIPDIAALTASSLTCLASSEAKVPRSWGR